MKERDSALTPDSELKDCETSPEFSLRFTFE